MNKKTDKIKQVTKRLTETFINLKEDNIKLKKESKKKDDIILFFKTELNSEREQILIDKENSIIWLEKTEKSIILMKNKLENMIFLYLLTFPLFIATIYALSSYILTTN